MAHLGLNPPPPGVAGSRAAALVSPARGVRAAWALAAAALVAQIAYPLLDGPWVDEVALRAVTVAAVVCFAAAAVVHAAAVRGPRWALGLVVIAGGLGLLAEAVGVATGWPFGAYAYAGTLGPQALGVPLLVPLAWLMMAYPCLLAGRALASALAPRAARRRWAAPLLGAWTLATWDLFLDPQMVHAGHWTWADPTPALPGVPGVPLTNGAGWLVTAGVMMVLLDRLPRRDRDGAPPTDTLPAFVLLWTWSSQVLANVAFWGRPAVAGWGGVLMGLTVVPYALSLRRSRPHQP